MTGGLGGPKGTAFQGSAFTPSQAGVSLEIYVLKVLNPEISCSKEDCERLWFVRLWTWGPEMTVPTGPSDPP